MEVFNSVHEQLLSQTKPSVLLDKIEFELNENENNLNDHKLLKQQYHFLKPDLKFQTSQNGLISNCPQSPGTNKLNGLTNSKSIDKNDGPKHTICPPNVIQLDWKQSRSIGAGYVNLGNTCFMNSVLQALTYCPPLVNYLLNSSNEHQNKCKVLGLCMTCELIKHMKNSFQNSGSVIRPQAIFHRLKSLAKQFQPGRQEDAHEFLRYVIDNIWKSCVINWESSHCIKLDSKSKETTFINQIFGGYHRSQVTCLSCKAKSDTYDYFMDFIMDIKTVTSLEKALEQFNQPEILRNENAYKCSKCNKKVAAEKRFTVHKAPNVATFQLKRFDYNRIFGGKITKNISYPETLNLRPYMSDNKGEPINYKLFAVLVHLGCTSNSGHYFCYVRNSNNNWYLMDDARVSATNLNQVLDQQAYMLFYVRVPSKQFNNRNDLSKNSLANSSSSLSIINSNGTNNKLLVNHNKSQLNGLTRGSDEPIAKKLVINLPRTISENVNGLKRQINGEAPKLVNTSSPASKLVNTSSPVNRLSILSGIESQINSNLNKSSTSLLKPKLSNGISKKPMKQKSVKRLVPYDDNSSSDESTDSPKDTKSLLSNGLKRFKSDDQSDKCNGSVSKESRNDLNKSSITTPQKTGNHLSQQYNRMFVNSVKKDVKSELKEMHLNLLGKNVNTWDGKKTQIDREVKEDLEKNRKKSKDDLYNEDYDRGKIKKKRSKSDDDTRHSSKHNPFQTFYNDQYMKGKTDKNKFIKSL